MAAKKAQSAKGNPAGKRMQNPKLKAKREANRVANERAVAVFVKAHPRMPARDVPQSRSAIRAWGKHCAPRPAPEAEGGASS